MWSQLLSFSYMYCSQMFSAIFPEIIILSWHSSHDLIYYFLFYLFISPALAAILWNHVDILPNLLAILSFIVIQFAPSSTIIWISVQQSVLLSSARLILNCLIISLHQNLCSRVFCAFMQWLLVQIHLCKTFFA